MGRDKGPTIPAILPENLPFLGSGQICVRIKVMVQKRDLRLARFNSMASLQFHSYRSAWVGAICEARRAGTYAASMVTRNSEGTTMR
jgi:hypothetical protein